MTLCPDEAGRYWEDFSEGEIYHHALSHTITMQENIDFCLLTRNPHPLHLDEDYAVGTRYGKIVVAGTFVLSLAVGLSVPDISISAIANLEYDRVIHHQPVFIGDTIHARSKILQITASGHNKPQGVITVETLAFNQKDELVLSFIRKVLLPQRAVKNQ
jgi:acyl dehydratase